MDGEVEEALVIYCEKLPARHPAHKSSCLPASVAHGEVGMRREISLQETGEREGEQRKNYRPLRKMPVLL